MRAQLGKAHPCTDRNRVADDVQIVLPKVDHAAPLRIGDEGVADDPFAGHFPVEHRCTRGDFKTLEGHVARDMRQRFAHAGAGNTAADRIDVAD